MKPIHYLFVTFLFIQKISYAGEDLSYRWLEVSYPYLVNYYEYERQNQWFLAEEERLNLYFEELNFPKLTQAYEKYYFKTQTRKEVKLPDGRVLKLTLTLPQKEFELLLDEKVIFNHEILKEIETAYKLTPSSVFNSFSLSPNKDFAVVPLHSYGDTVNSHLLFLNLLEKGKIQSLARNVIDYQWIGPTQLKYVIREKYDSTLNFDLLSGETKINFTDIDRYLGTKSTEDGQFIVKKTKETNEKEKSEWLIEIRPMNSPYAKNIKFKPLEQKEQFQFVEKTDHFFIFANNHQNFDRFYLLPYSFKIDGELSLGEIVTIKANQAGSFQKTFSDGEYLLAEFIAGPFRHYYLINKKGEIVKVLNAPKFGSLKKLKDLKNNTFELTYYSVVNNKVVIGHHLHRDEWNPNKIDKKLLKDEEGNSYRGLYHFVSSKDGTRIPLIVYHRENLELRARTPLYINAYGGHGIVTYFRPSYDVSIHEYLKRGGVYSTFAIRGGGEYGNRWYTSVFKKLVRYEDTESCIKFLHDHEIGSPQTTAFEGWSSGGLLAGVMLTRNPELFRLVIPGNGLHDMERNELLGINGANAWIKDYGGYYNQEEVDFIRSYSPFVMAQKKQHYPMVYFMVGAHDQRVNPSHTYKMVQALRDHQLGDSPILMRRFSLAGHWPDALLYMGAAGYYAKLEKWKVIFHELGIKDSP